jgi:hypothetical protein
MTNSQPKQQTKLGDTKMTNINPTTQNRKLLRAHAREALANYSPVMTWLLLDDRGNLAEICEAQGQTDYVGDDQVIAVTGSFAKAHGDGAACNDDGYPYSTQRAYLTDLLGADCYSRVFAQKQPARRYWVRVIHDDGSSSVLTHRDKTVFCKRNAMKYADEFFLQHGKVCYVIPE